MEVPVLPAEAASTNSETGIKSIAAEDIDATFKTDSVGAN
jgi:hypothetical protein